MMKKAKTTKGISKPLKKKKVASSPVRSKKKTSNEYTEVIHCKYRSETGHWILYGELKNDPGQLVELRKFTNQTWTLGAWRRSAKIIESKQDTCHVYSEDGSKIEYTLVRGVQDHKPKIKASKVVSCDLKEDLKEEIKEEIKPVEVTVIGRGKLEGLEKTGKLISEDEGYQVEFFSKASGVNYVIGFDKRSLEQFNPNPHHSWKMKEVV